VASGSLGCTFRKIGFYCRSW